MWRLPLKLIGMVFHSKFREEFRNVRYNTEPLEESKDLLKVWLPLFAHTKEEFSIKSKRHLPLGESKKSPAER